MPTPKRKIFLKMQRRKQRVKRKKLVVLNPTEQKNLSEFKRLEQWVVAATHGRGESQRSLYEVNGLHRADFAEVVLKLSKEFPGKEIRVLDEGAGMSTFGRELSKVLSGKVKVAVVRTDIDKNVAPHAAVSPEELSRTFGPNSFHLIVSTFGGANYTPISQKKAIANIIYALKPGGIASIFTRDQPTVFTGGKTIRAENIASALKKYRNIAVQQEFLLDDATSLITIKKLK